jgi:DNA-binding MarR family transcriptional regulator
MNTDPAHRDRPRPDEVREAAGLVRTITRGLWRRRGPALEREERRLGRRHLAVLVAVASEAPLTVGDVARTLGLSLPAASKLTRELEDEGLVRRSEHADDRRRTVVELDEQAASAVRAWVTARSRPFAAALEALSTSERAAFLKGLRALAAAVEEETGDLPRRHGHRHGGRRRGGA